HSTTVYTKTPSSARKTHDRHHSTETYAQCQASTPRGLKLKKFSIALAWVVDGKTIQTVQASGSNRSILLKR
ncbi:uncharacterized protein FOMMEDRAFT_170129, partial [Fomitiporia mediterranea MF3/22]|uniref:uncharacterized protein n=1 Tax=Fomitiporia mediterranea (strain MF3/22) TaxID=694068 RepID=UPI0004409157